MLAFLEAIAARLEDTDIVLEGLLLYRTIDTAEGVWLDQVGDIVGYPRPAAQTADNLVFTLKSIGDPDVGTQALSSLSGLDGGLLSSLNGLPTSSLASDSDYRTFLKGKVRATYSGCDIPSIWQFIDFVFSVDATITSPSVGQIDIELPSALTRAEREVIEELCPRSAGMLLTIVNWP
jgi:hypothetical protein